MSGESVENLNTMDSFTNGFRIERDGKVFTLTQKEMSDFRYLDKAMKGSNSFLYVSNNCVDKGKSKIMERLSNNEETCYELWEELEDILSQDSGGLEHELVYDFVNNYLKEKLKQ